MADTVASPSAGSRRNFLHILTGAGFAVAAGATLWPLLDALTPDATADATARPLIDVAALAEGAVMTVTWAGQPVLIRKLTEAQSTAAQAVAPDTLPDPAGFSARVKPGSESFVVVVGLNTGIPCALAQNGAQGWVCPCDGSEYDVLGRVLSGPAARNLAIPRYTFITDAQLRLG